MNKEIITRALKKVEKICQNFFLVEAKWPKYFFRAQKNQFFWAKKGINFPPNFQKKKLLSKEQENFFSCMTFILLPHVLTLYWSQEPTIRVQVAHFFK